MSDTSSFAENYATLHDATEKLQEMGEADIDQLIPIVERGLAAHKACEQRIKAVQQMLDQLAGGTSQTTAT